MEWVLALPLVVLAFLIIRFVHPQLIYVLRQELARVRSNRLFLAYAQYRKEGSLQSHTKVGTDFRTLLAQDFQREFRVRSGAQVRGRLLKIRQLLRSLVASKGKEKYYPEGKEPTICLAELARLLEGTSRLIQPTGIYDPDPVTAPQLLRMIVEYQRPNDFPHFSEVDDLERWFENNIMSIEQAVELVYAAVYALSYRIVSKP